MKKILRIGTAILLVSFVAFIQSCQKEYFVPAPPVDPSLPVDSVSYTDDIQPFFNASCTNCHYGGGIPLDLTSPGSYNNLFSSGQIDLANPANSKLYVKMLPGESMAQYATNAERDMTLQWITEGALNN